MSDTVKLHCTVAGSGLPVVLLHGFPLDRSIWRAQVRELSQQFQVICPDLRGHGDSPAPPGPYDMSLMAQDVFALLDSLHVDKAVWLGHSMGGYVTLAGWHLAPQRFLGLGLVASHAAADTDEGRTGRLKLIEKVTAEGAQAAADAMLPKIFIPGATPPAEIEAVRQIMLRTPVPGIVGALQGMAARPDRTADLARITVPALVLAGGQDQIISQARAEATDAALPNGTLALINHAGHMPMLEQPDETTAALRDFLAPLAKAN